MFYVIGCFWYFAGARSASQMPFLKVKLSLVPAVSRKRLFQPNVLAVGRYFYKEQIKNKLSIVDKNDIILQGCINS